MEDKTQTETKQQHRVEHVTDLYPDGPEKPTVFHYVRRTIRGDATALCGEVIPARNALYGDEPRSPATLVRDLPILRVFVAGFRGGRGSSSSVGLIDPL